MSTRWKIIGGLAGWLVCAAGVTSAIFLALPWLVGLNAVGVGFWSYNLCNFTRERNEHRRAARDRDDPDPFASFVAGAPIYSSGTLTFHTGTGLNVTPFNAAPEKKGLKESTAEVPILAYKVARLVWMPNLGPTFAPLNTTTRFGSVMVYGSDADAICVVENVYYRSRYDVPRAVHGACPSVDCSCGFYACTDQSMLNGGHAILEVELSGRVIVCERGYRAGHQRVIRAHLRGCYFCGVAPSVASFEPENELRLRCAAHIEATPTIPVEELTRLLGVPVDVDKSVHAEDAS